MVIATETGTTAETIEAQAKANPQLKAGDLLMGNKIVSLTKKPATEVFAARRGPGMWLPIGESYGVPSGTLMDSAKRVSAQFR